MNQSPRESTQPSWHKIFPLVAQSPAMKELVNAAVALAHNHQIVCVQIPAADRLEARSFFFEAVRAHAKSQDVFVIGRQPLKSGELKGDDATSLLFLFGDDVSESLQWEILHNRYSFPVIMLLLDDPQYVTAQDLERLRMAFRDVCAAGILRWPSWSNRVEDHDEIVHQIHARLSMPQGRNVPRLHSSALDLIRSSSFDGTLHVEREIKSALQRYIQQRSNGPLMARHFPIWNGLKALSSHREIAPLSLVR